MTEAPATRATRYLTVALRWLLILAVVFVSTNFVGNYITDHVLPQIYTASSTLQVPPGDMVVPTAVSRPEPVAFQPEFENTIRSPDFLLAVIKDLNLEQEWARRIYKTDEQVADADALTHMEKVLSFQADASKNAVIITASSDVPKEAADIANAVAERYKVVSNMEVKAQLQKDPVRVLFRAEVPTIPMHPNKHVTFVVTMILASIASLLAASFVEIIFLFLRAGERAGN